MKQQNDSFSPTTLYTVFTHVKKEQHFTLTSVTQIPLRATQGKRSSLSIG